MFCLRKWRMRVASGIVAVVVVLGVLLIGGQAQAGLDKIAAAVELIKGIAEAAKGDSRAQVRVKAKTDGPDADDRAFNSAEDIDDWLGETELDAEAEARAENPQYAYAELHYKFWDEPGGRKGWGPNPVHTGPGRPFRSSQFYAWAYPDSTPEEGSDNKTIAVAVGAFAHNGEIEFEGKKEDDKTVKQIPKSPKVQATDMGLLSFKCSHFTMEIDPVNSGLVHVRPRQESMNVIDMFHNYAGYASARYFYTGTLGLSPQSDELAAEIAAASASAAGLPLADPTERAELTFGSAAVSLGSAVLNRYKIVDGDPVLKMEGELLAEYANAWVVGPTSNSQVGYTPNVLGKTVLVRGSLFPTEGLPAELAGELPTTFEDDIGLFFYVDSYLENALSLAMNTPGSSMYEFLSQLNPGDTFTVDLSFGHGAGGAAFDDNTAFIPEPSSLFALGTGLIGIAGIALRRRRA